jgi:hypothetical protein
MKVTINLSKATLMGLGAVVAAGLMISGVGLGILIMHPSTSTPATATGQTGSHSTSPSPSGTTPHSPFTVGNAFAFQTSVDTLSGHPTTLARGSRATVVMAMASWCLYCGYEDKWVWPQIVKTPGVTIDVVDVSPQGGIADPGPRSPAFSGHDGSGGSLTVAGMETVMTQYKKTFGTLNAPNIHIYIAPSATQQAWNIQSFPTIAWVNAAGRIAQAAPGAMTLTGAQSVLHQVLANPSGQK